MNKRQMKRLAVWGLVIVLSCPSAIWAAQPDEQPVAETSDETGLINPEIPETETTPEEPDTPAEPEEMLPEAAAEELPETVEETPDANARTADARQAEGWKSKNGRLWYQNADGSYTKSDFQQIGNHWYYFDADGWLVTGWRQIGDSWYYLKKTGEAGDKGRALTGWRTFAGKTYYLKRTGGKGITGKMFTGVQNINGQTYRFASTGELLTGWQVISGRTYYFQRTGAVGTKGRMLTGWREFGGKTFYLMKTGQKGVKGKMLTGWQSIGGRKYYFKASGASGVKGQRFEGGWKRIAGQEYLFDTDGVLQSRTMTNEEFVAYIGPIAHEDMKKTGILASVTTAQAILESGYGSTELAVQANNLFGMKASLSGNTWSSDWGGQTYDKKTIEYDEDGNMYTEVATFRRYGTHAASVKDHSDYLAGAKNGTQLRYKGVVGNKSYKKTVELIKKGGYATDPKYVDKLCDIIERWNLTQYD